MIKLHIASKSGEKWRDYDRKFIMDIEKSNLFLRFQSLP